MLWPCRACSNALRSPASLRVVVDLARSTTPRLVVEPFQTMLCKPLAPRPRGLPGDTDSIGNLAVVEAIGRP